MPSRETFLRVVYGLDPMKPELTFGQDTMAVGDLLRAAVKQALAEQEARHKREVLEAKISALMDFRVEIGNETGLDDALAMYLTYIRAELAALEEK